MFRSEKARLKTVAFMCTSLNNMAGGLERQIIRTAIALSEQGYKVYLVSFDSEKDSSFYEIPKEIIWIKCGQNLPPHKSANIIKRLIQLIYLRKSIVRTKASCLITFHHGLYLRSLAGTIFTDIRNIVSERNSLKFYNYIQQKKYNLAYIFSLFADARTVQIKAYIAEYPIFAQKRITVIPNILPKRKSNNCGPDLEKRKVCLLGRIEAQKNYSLLLDQMLDNINNIDFSVEVAGDGSLMNDYKYKYKKLEENGFLQFRGNVKDIYQLLNSCTLLCFPSLWEGYPNALIEALYCGLPIITTTRMADLDDFVEHNFNGLIVTDKELIKTIKYLLNEREMLKKFSNNSLYKYSLLSQNDPTTSWVKLIESISK